MSENYLKNLTFDKTTEEGMGNLIFRAVRILSATFFYKKKYQKNIIF